MNKNKKAFTLVELSIVLMIIALLVAGVSSGTKLLHTAKINKFISEISSIEESINVFRGIYSAYPGDISNAVELWGSGSSNVNGDGDQYIEWSSEVYAAWLHLTKAELISDKGFTSTLLNSSDTWSDGSFWVINTKSSSGTKHGGYDYAALGENLIQFGGGAWGNDAVFLPKESYMIDLKMDDSLPQTGRVSYRNLGDSSDANCTNSTTSYYATSSVIGCNLIKTF